MSELPMWTAGQECSVSVYIDTHKDSASPSLTVITCNLLVVGYLDVIGHA